MKLINERTVLKLGKYSIWQDKHNHAGMVWIEQKGGEGGEFSIEALEKAIDKFYEENF